MTESTPILYSFRRCPYAMRARMAIVISGVRVSLREVVLRDKPGQMLAASPKGTVPVLVLDDGMVIDESIDVMHWALAQSDPEGWLLPDRPEQRVEIGRLIEDNDGPFKHHLDRFKYATRYEGADPEEHRTAIEPYLLALNERLSESPHLMGDSRTLADIAIFPFVRQFVSAANERNADWMQSPRFAALNRWLGGHVASPIFSSIMQKYPQWKSGDAGVPFLE